MTTSSTRRRAAYILADPGVPAFGTKGSTLHVHEVIRSLARFGFDVDLFAIRFDQDSLPGLPVRAVHRLSPCPKGDPATRERQCMALNVELRSALSTEGPYDLVYERYSLWSSAGMDYADESGVPGILEVNAPLIEEQATYRELVHQHEAEAVASVAFGTASLVVAVSEAIEEYVRIISPDAVTMVVPNGVNPDRFSSQRRPDLTRRGDEFTIGFLGHLKPWQGISELADIFAQVSRSAPHTRLLVVGDGPERGNLKDRLDQGGLTHAATLTGKIAHDEVPAQLARMDVGVAPYPSVDRFYFSPLKVVEYMAAGLPVVASNLGQIATVVQHGRTGYLCEPGEPECFSQHILELASDPEASRAMGRRAREHVLAFHTWDAGVRRVLECVDLLSAEPARGVVVP